MVAPIVNKHGNMTSAWRHW